MTMLISTTNINRGWTRKKVLNNLSFNLESGEIVAIVGRSGAGKSTFLNIIGLLDNNFDGEFEFDGIKILPNHDYSSIRRDSIGFVFQSYFLLPKLSVTDNILMPLNYKNVSKQEYYDELKRIANDLYISDLLEEKVDNLSGGEKQRVAIARAILCHPKVIICDEPTGNLDQYNSKIVLDALKRESRRGAGIVVVTHNLELARQCGKVLFLREGALYEKDI